MLPPLLQVPEPLRGNEIGTFAHDSIVRRLPEIAHRTLAENDLDERRSDLVRQLADEVNTGTITAVDEPAATDADRWDIYTQDYLGETWLDVPWFFAETYFYRRLLAATGFSQPGSRLSLDPFLHQKQAALEGAIALADRLGAALDDPQMLLGASLWANQVDLSLWPAGEAAADIRTRSVLTSDQQSQFLVDDTAAALPQLAAGGTLHLVLDNAGAELVADLALAASVIARGGQTVLHAKPHPTFVSDTTPEDITTTIERLANEDSAASRIAATLESGLEAESLRITAHPFWVSPLPFWECPADLAAGLGVADLIVMKGDANYRRLLGDRHWDLTTAFEDIVRPPAPLLALRTAKSEVIAGITAAVARRALQSDPDWLTDGRWGVAQYARAAT